MEGKRAKFITLAVALLLIALILAGCTVQPDDTGTKPGGVGAGVDEPFQVRGTTPPPEEATPTPAIDGIITPPDTSADPSAAPTGWGSIIISPDPLLTPTGTAWGGIITVTHTPGPDASPSPTSTVLKLGSSGPEVRSIQQKLKNLGYDVGSVDGDFGKSTENAVKAFQERNKLRADGIAGLQTINRLNSSSALPARPTPRITPVPSIKPGTYLQLGSSGSEVRRLQEALVSLGYLSGTPNGKFDVGTEAAVYAFQRRHTSYADGIAGQLTLEKLYSSSARKTSTVAGIIGGDSLEKGSKNTEAVRRVQRRLRELGYYAGSADGDFGASTEAAVKAFQRNHGLSTDGKVGTLTYDTLFGSNARRAGQTNTPRPGQTPTPTRIPYYVEVTPNPNPNIYVTLREGDSGRLVRQLQQALKNQGYYKGEVDGLFGFGTTEAVLAFQKAKGLSRDGVAGPGTQRLLYQGDFPSES